LAEWLALASEAIGAYRGDLLAEPFFLDWFEPERQYYRQRFVRIGLLCGQDYENTKKAESAREIWELVLKYVPTCAEAHQELINFFERQGYHTLAAAQRERFKQALAVIGIESGT
ncbi:MAG: hypothetical protein HY692_04470, partial [Cyanobacteria bacterium NC_groundwater_1444_Ag_S-0.65um_54_12]|nr:hypothetical protein [Cyanobacteria bacterium NC_groundwater_1444_Ag_S-0.65um_54_12]